MKVKLNIETERVKSISFHNTRPYMLFSTYDGKVCLYDFEIGVELFHIQVTSDFKPVRCAEFHPTQPLFGCGTDDGEIMIYNWQKKVKLFTLNGHSDFIRSLDFHKIYPLLITASDDSTVRIWNWQSRYCISVMEDHTYFVMSAKFNPEKPLVATGCLDNYIRIFSISNLLQTSMSKDVDSFLSLSNDDGTELIAELEEHENGVECISWDRTGNKLLSCGDDCVVKLYTLVNNELVFTKLISTFNGIVTTCCFHEFSSNIVAGAEDGNLRLFDGLSYQQISSYSFNGSRIWCCSCHHKDSLIAVGHDKGLTVLKFAKGKPVYDVQGNSVLWIQNNELHLTNLASNTNENPIMIHSKVSSVSWNNARGLALVSNDEENVIVDIKMKVPFCKNNSGSSAIWLSRSSIATLSESKDKLLVNEIGGVTARQIQIPKSEHIFSSSAQRVYLSTRLSLILFDVIKSQSLVEIPFRNAKSVTFDDKKEMICVRNQNSILIAKADLSEYHIYTESSKIKSCCWHGKAILYTTRNSLKYILKSESGIISSLPSVLYIVKAINDKAWFITCECELIMRNIELSELHLKAALMSNNNDLDVMRIIAKKAPIGQAIMEFAVSQKRYDVATALATDPIQKFEFSLKSFDFDTASRVADELNDPEIYLKLSKSALENGRFELAEKAMKNGNDTDSLAFLYLISGESDKLKEISKKSNNLLYSLWSNDDDSFKNILSKVAPNIEVEPNNFSIEYGKKVLSDWPIVGPGYNNVPVQLGEEDINDIDGWGSDDMSINDGSESKNDENEGWDIDLDIDQTEALTQDSSLYVPPIPGKSIYDEWASTSQTAGEYVAAGSFSDALLLLNQTISACNTELLRELFVSFYISNNACLSWNFDTVTIPLSSTYNNQRVPHIFSPLQQLEDLKKELFSKFFKNELQACHEIAQTIIQKIILLTVNTKEEEQTILEYIGIARNYCVASILGINRRKEEEKKNMQRAIELSVYLTHLKLNPTHLLLVLRSAMSLTFRSKNFITAKSIVSRMHKYPLPPKVSQQVQGVETIVNQSSNNSNQYAIEYDDKIPFEICAKSLKPIYRRKPHFTCPLCGAKYLPQYKGEICCVCNISKIGGTCTGLKIVRE